MIMEQRIRIAKAKFKYLAVQCAQPRQKITLLEFVVFTHLVMVTCRRFSCLITRPMSVWQIAFPFEDVRPEVVRLFCRIRSSPVSHPEMPAHNLWINANRHTL